MRTVKEKLYRGTRPERGGGDARLRSQQVLELLRRIPGWLPTPTGRALVRVREFTSPFHAEAFATFVAFLTAPKSQPVKITIAEDQVTVLLRPDPRLGSRAGITRSMLDLAAAIG